MNTRRLLFALILIAVVIAVAAKEGYDKTYDKGFSEGYARGSKPLAASEEKSEDKAFTKENFVTTINRTREALSLSALPIDSYLEGLAQGDIENYCGKIKQPGFQLTNDNTRFPDYRFYGEIVSEDTATPAAVLGEWASNVNHQPILLRPDFTAMGVGIKDTCVAVIFANK